MKKTILMAAVSLTAMLASAQQALWNTAPTVSPEINSDNTVTFRLNAPKASEVKVTGDFCLR